MLIFIMMMPTTVMADDSRDKALGGLVLLGALIASPNATLSSGHPLEENLEKPEHHNRDNLKKKIQAKKSLTKAH